MTTRRQLITGLATFVAAPAIVRASSLMPVKSQPLLNPCKSLLDDKLFFDSKLLFDGVGGYAYVTVFRDNDKVTRNFLAQHLENNTWKIIYEFTKPEGDQ